MPCCAIDYTELFKNYGSEILDTNENSIDDYFKSPFLKKMRKAMKENDRNFLKGICKNCIKSEEAVIGLTVNGIYKDLQKMNLNIRKKN